MRQRPAGSVNEAVRLACIDIGSNTTRLLVADCEPGRLAEIHQQRVFTRLSRGLSPSGTLSEQKIEEVASVVADQLREARALGAANVYTLATAAIRRARNGDALAGAVGAAAGVEVRILSEQEEARLAFVGAARTLEWEVQGPLGVVDVGGGSSELIVGRVPDTVGWSRSFAVGSGDLADAFLGSDPPSAGEVAQARASVKGAFSGVRLPDTEAAVAVGGSATSLRRLAGERLDEPAFGRLLELLMSARAAEIARRYALDEQRVRLLPAGLLILHAAAELFGATLRIGRGGIREGALLEAAG